jgi:hypothetical protein
VGKLTDDEAKSLEALLAKKDAPDEDDFDIEIFEGDKGARVPYSRGRSWLQRTFGIDLDEDPEKETGEGGKDDPPAGPETKRAFGRRIA